MSPLLERVLVAVLAVCAMGMTALAVRREVADHRDAEASEARAAAFAPRRVENVRVLASEGHAFGAPAARARITLVEFSDYECPYCYALHATLRELLRRHPDVSIVYRHYPAPAHRMALPAAIASECAADQGRFAQFSDALFAAQESLAVIPWREFASRAGLADIEAFEGCRVGFAARDRVQRDISAGARLGIVATPTLLLRDEMVAGAASLENLEAWIRTKGFTFTPR